MYILDIGIPSDVLGIKETLVLGRRIEEAVGAKSQDTPSETVSSGYCDGIRDIQIRFETEVEALEAEDSAKSMILGLNGYTSVYPEDQ